MKISTRLGAVALACALGLPAAHAADVASASSSITGLTYRLIDLDTTDGITPWIQFNNNHVLAGTGFPWGNQLQVAAGSIFAPPALTVTDDGLLASASTLQTSAQMASSEIENAPLTDPATYNGEHHKFSMIQSAYGSGTDIELGMPVPFPGEFSLTLSANTTLVIEGTFNVTSQLDASQLAQGSLLQGIQNDQYKALFMSGGVASLALYSVQDYDGSPLSQQEDFAEASLWLEQTLTTTGVQADGPNADSVQQAFSVQLTNTTSSDFHGGLNLLLGSQIRINLQKDPVVVIPEVPGVPAIPEPGTWNLLGIGLALLAWRVRARRA